MPSHKGFVQRNGSSLALGNDAFYFAGANCHYLLTHAANEDQRPLVLEVLDDAQRLNLTVLRIWAFCDGPDEWNALQREPGQLSEHVLEGLDWLIEEAGRRGLRLLLVLTNYWPDYGGMPAYVRWRFGIPDRSSHNPQTHPTSLFYTDPQCQATFRRATAALLARVNRRTGLAYTADPTILGWDVANEPRCEGPGGADVVRDFVGSTAEFVKRLAPRQLVTSCCTTTRTAPPPRTARTGRPCCPTPHWTSLACTCTPTSGARWTRRGRSSRASCRAGYAVTQRCARGGSTSRWCCRNSASGTPGATMAATARTTSTARMRSRRCWTAAWGSPWPAARWRECAPGCWRRGSTQIMTATRSSLGRRPRLWPPAPPPSAPPAAAARRRRRAPPGTVLRHRRLRGRPSGAAAAWTWGETRGRCATLQSRRTRAQRRRRRSRHTRKTRTSTGGPR